MSAKPIQPLYHLKTITLAVALVLLMDGCRSARIISPSKSLVRTDNLALGNPSGASTTDPENHLLTKRQYALSYSRSRGIANWASWHLNQSWKGNVRRTNEFRPDPALPTGWYTRTGGPVRTSDYTNTGFDGSGRPSGSPVSLGRSRRHA